MSQQDNPMGEQPIGRGRRPVAHYIGMVVVVVALCALVAAIT